tara:strand:+ start:1890 stop:2630 length:741 start_codon:yes stop_codon:yes gene_type:complete
MKFFNRFRRKIFGTGFGKYLMYAIGEIVLVVIGILLAVSINNYYQKESATKKTKEVTQQIYNQMVSDSLKITDYLVYLRKLDSTITYFRLPREEKLGFKKPLQKVSKLTLFIDRDNNLLEISDLVSTQIQGFDFSSTTYSQLLYNIQTEYTIGIKNIQNQSNVVLTNNRRFNDSLKKYDWYIKWSAETNCANDCIIFITKSKEFNTQLAFFQYEKTYIYKIRIEQFQSKLRKHIESLKTILDSSIL